MTPDADLYALFGAEDEPTVQEQAAALAAALRGKRALADTTRAAGNLGLLTGDKVLSGFGQAQLQNAAQAEDLAARQEAMLAQAGGQQGQRRFSELMAERQQGFNQANAKTGHEYDLEKQGRALGAQKEMAGLDAAAQMQKFLLEQQAREQKAAAEGKDAATKHAMDLRKEWQGRPEFKEFQGVSNAFDTVTALAKSGNAADDMAMVFTFMKALDPSSSVKEGEYASARNTTGVPGVIMNAYNQAKDGKLLNPEQRKEFVATAKRLFDTRKAQVDPIAKYYMGQAEKLGIAPEDVVASYGSAQPVGPAVPVAGGGDIDLDGADLLPPEQRKRLLELRATTGARK